MGCAGRGGCQLVIFRQSMIKEFTECPLRHRFRSQGAPREQSSAMSFGSAIHDAVMTLELNYDLRAGLDRFDAIWGNLAQFDWDYDYILPRNSHLGYHDLGHRILRDWWMLIQWDTDVVLAREHFFSVPLGDDAGEHILQGTADKVVLRRMKGGQIAVVASDYKTGSKTPTRDYLAHDVQFSAYSYATTQPEFWINIPNGADLYQQYLDAPRYGEWVQLRAVKRIDAGIRTDVHYNRLRYACEQIALAINLGIYVPDLSGETCEYCEFRKICGLPTRAEEGLE